MQHNDNALRVTVTGKNIAQHGLRSDAGRQPGRVNRPVYILGLNIDQLSKAVRSSP